VSEDKLTPIEVTCSIGGVSAKAGNCAKIGMSTTELSFEDLTRVLRLKDLSCVVTIKPFNNLDEAPKVMDGDLKTKSPSVRVRGCLYVWWEQSGKPDTWETWYNVKMEEIIDFIKRKLD
jgi:hypothetical protein